MRIENLMDCLPANYNLLDREMIMRAYQMAEQAHRGQKRASGEPYISHCLAVAAILAEMRVPPAVVAAGLLHDTLEDTSLPVETIRSEFGEEVVKLVDGVTKLTNLPRVSKTEEMIAPISDTPDAAGERRHAAADDEPEVEQPNLRSRKRDLASETLRKTFLAMGDDIRVVLIKLADRLHNMRTLGFMPEAKRVRIGKETLDIFAPLANRLGIWQIKWELEDLAFRYVDPEKFKEIAENLAERRADRESKIRQIIQDLHTTLQQNGIQAEITGRPKHIYSIYKKMVTKGKAFEMVRDLRGVRLIVADIPTCYAALGVIHTHWRPIPHEFDDYIAAPKDNFYQSLHTAVIYDDGKALEIQIRTAEMDQSAEYGIAAHWRYKEGTHRDLDYEQRITWLRKLMEWRQDVEDAQEFVDGMKTDVFQDRAYVFTPKGDIIDLPAGSTPIDFAYHVHTEIGNRCRGAKINGKLVTLDYALRTGDQVEILTAKQGGPSRDWLNPNLGMVRTQRARAKIKQWFKKQDEEQNLSQGRLILERELRRLGLSNYNIDELIHDFGYTAEEDFFVGIGCGDLSIGRVINKLSEADQAKIDDILNARPSVEGKNASDTTVTVVGLKGILTTMARCCNPAPGDQIIGYITRGRGATIHRQDCPNMLRQQERERLVKVSWGEPQRTYPVSVQVKAYDRQGLMGDISTILNNEGVNLIDIDLKITHNLAVIDLVLEVETIEKLSKVLTKIENLPNVMEAHRMRPG
jgi:GTP pyrophosphokinase